MAPRRYRDVIKSALEHDVPIGAIAFYSRWWQLEIHLRSLIYLELRARYGISWLDRLSTGVRRRAGRDAANAYMKSVDAEDALSYADFGELLTIIDNDDDWTLFEDSLLPRVRWRGVADELRDLRNRIMHSRRPHRDDVSRVEAVLRDLEAGAHVAYRPYADPDFADDALAGPVVSAWIEREHEAAQRLIGHGERQYETRFHLMYSLRPWANSGLPKGPEGSPGLLWHARWSTRDGYYSIRDFWDDYYVDESRGLMVHVLQRNPWSLVVTFSGADDPKQVADAIEPCYDAALGAREPYLVDPDREESWPPLDVEFPSKVQAGTVMARADSLAFGDFFGVSQ